MIPDHHTDVDENPEKSVWDKAMSQTVDVLLYETKFMKKYQST